MQRNQIKQRLLVITILYFLIALSETNLPANQKLRCTNIFETKIKGYFNTMAKALLERKRMKEEQMLINKKVTDMIAIGKTFYDKNWLLGTSGNLSSLISRDPLRFIITASGMDKGTLIKDAFVEVIGENNGSYQVTKNTSKKPSGETLLHKVIYQYTDAETIIHIHSSEAVFVAELFANKGIFTFQGYEVQKGLGFKNICEECRIPILENKENLHELANEFISRWEPSQIAFLIKNHGLFVWGRSLSEAKRCTELLQHMFEYSILKKILR